MTRTVIEQHLASRWAGTWLTGEGQELRLGVELAATGELIGDAVLFWRSREHRAGEIGYVLHPGPQGHGYATEAARAVLSLGFDLLGLHRIVARIDERNEASARMARRLGMRQESRLVHRFSRVSGGRDSISVGSPWTGGLELRVRVVLLTR